MKKEYTLQIGLIGFNHKTAPVEIREHFAFDKDTLKTFIDEVKNDSNISEIAYIATCNRIEIYFVSYDIENATFIILRYLEKYSSINIDDFTNNIYKKYHIDAVKHLLAVASSLDSMVIGENEILNQLKQWYRWAVFNKTTGAILNKLFHQAFKTAKKVKTETEISKNPLSVAFIAAELSRKIFDDLSNCKAMLIGAGEMASLILKYLKKFNIKQLIIANRSLHNAQMIANEINLEAKIIPLSEIPDYIDEVDIILSSATSHNYLITKQMVKNNIKKRNNPLFFIDIAVPRNIDPEISSFTDVFLYNIDDLKSIADENLKNRLHETTLAMQLVESDAYDFFKWYESLEVVPLIVHIQNKFDKIRKNELKKYHRRKLKHLSDEDFKIVEELTKQIMTKTLHLPITYLKNLKDNNEINIQEAIKIIEEMFDK